MLTNFELDKFISNYITRRDNSLLTKDLTDFDFQLQERIQAKNVLVIGGAGTIGASFIKSILKYKVSKLVVVDIDENGLTELVRDLRSSSSYIMPNEFITYPVNFGDNLFDKIFKYHGPFEIVANFAAHKHVRSEKDIFSIEAMIYNNIFRAKKLMDLLVQFPPEHFFCVSTDKAANPVNIMGASKKLMEEMIISYSDLIPTKTARFANVAFSQGSLPLGFLERLKKRQPLACPLEIKRFFVSPKESGEICLIASILGESGDIFFPKLDNNLDMIPFQQILLDLLNVLELQPDICSSEEEAKQKSLLLTNKSKTYPIYFFLPDTSGEKSFEEFYTDEEVLNMKKFSNLGIVKNSRKRTTQEINQIIKEFHHFFDNQDITKADIVNIFNNFLPNFRHIETGKGLDSKM